MRNRSEQYEARFTMVEVLDSPSLFFAGMAGSRMPIAVHTVKAMPNSRGSAQRATFGHFALRRQSRACHRTLSGKSQWLRGVTGSLQPTDAASCHIRERARAAGPGIPVSGAAAVRGFACSVMRAGGTQAPIKS